MAVVSIDTGIFVFCLADISCFIIDIQFATIDVKHTTVSASFAIDDV